MTSILRKLSIRSRLLLMLLFVCGIAAAILIYIGYQSGQAAIRQGVFNQLTSVRAAKKYEVENYFNEISSIVEVLGDNATITTALREFKTGFRQLSTNQLDVDCSRKLNNHYEDFLDQLAQNLDVKPTIELYYPNTTAACYLQFEYIVENKFPNGQKQLLQDAQDGSYYSEVHRKHHAHLTKITEEFGFYDIFLVDLETGDIVYTSFKETDFATNLYNGPYRESNLAMLTRQLRSDSDINQARMIDFAHYRPSYGTPAAFIGISITQNSETIGALILQISIDEINRITTGNQNWKSNGLGETGENYLVGKDHLMRSVSRFFLQDTLGFRQTLTDLNVPIADVDRMYRTGTTILQQDVRSEAIELALLGKQDTRIAKDYRGESVLSAFTPLQIAGLDWVLISEMDLAEAYLPIERFKRRIFIALCVIILLVTFFAMYLAGRFVKPIEKLTAGIQYLKTGDYHHRIEVVGNDEFSELGNQFNEMLNNIEQQQKKITHQNQENEKLLLNFIPATIARRLKNGETKIAELHRNVSLIVVDVIGFSQLTHNISADEAIELLNDLISAFDTAADKHQVEKVHTIGDSYFAACGLFTPRLDHAKRLIDFARETQQIIKQYNINHRTELAIQASIHTGEVIAGIVGREKYDYDLLGTTVNDVFAIKKLNRLNSIIISEAAYQKVNDFYQFETLSISPQSDIPQPLYQLIETKKPVHHG